jgi:23S rRNA (pseudouridine1915-N3)-methyltransferase
MKIDILCIGRLKRGPQQDLLDEYLKRLHWQATIREFDSKKSDPAARQAEEHAQLISWLQPNAALWALDEKGANASSKELADKLALYQRETPYLQCIIGGADGLLPEMRQRADFLLSFGRCTWPHQMVRVMLAEQLYRCQQILAGHPYHRDG